MNLTLELDDISEDIFVIHVYSPLPFNELVYYVNNQHGSQFCLDRNGFILKRNNTNLTFPYYADDKEDENHSFIISNLSYSNLHKPEVKQASLFESELNIETKHFLQNRFKKHNFFVLSSTPVSFHTFDTHSRTLFTRAKHITEYKPREQSLFQQIYYEKQS